MKIIVLGKDPRPPVEKPWWSDMVVTCERCSTQAQLELNDRPYQKVDEASGQITQVSAICPVCKDVIVAKRPAATTALTKLAQEHQPTQ